MGSADDLITARQVQLTAEAPTLPAQAEVFQMPRRFGHVPVDDAPLGWDTEKRFEVVYPRVELPFQEVERVTFGHPELEPNELYFGDCLHVMRMLPSESIDLIYIDPPFFSGKHYNLIFGDKSELRSFSDIWEGGLNGYLVWLNARLYEMKRLLTSTGSLYVHLDWHASHYVKVELDRIFGYENFRNEIIWCYSGGGVPRDDFPRKHDVILRYAKGRSWFYAPEYRPYTEGTQERGRTAVKGEHSELREEGTPVTDWWTDIEKVTSPTDPEKIGYPTQKSIALLQRIIETSSKPGDVVADFFAGGGTTAVVASGLRVSRKNGRKVLRPSGQHRRWIACDISRVAVSITADRVAKVIEGERGTGRRAEIQTTLNVAPDFIIANWGVYEVDRLTELNDQAFREFVVKAYAGRLAAGGDEISGYKRGEPLFVGPARQEQPIGVKQVGEFAKAVLKRGERDEVRGTMLGWAFTREAQVAAERLLAERRASIRFVRLKLVTLESPDFKAHVVERSPQYEHLLTFVLEPAVRFSAERTGPLKYRFDASESQSLNPGGSIINVQWDFDYRHYFTSSAGFEFSRKKDGLVLDASYLFPRTGTWKVACRMQDDIGGEATAIVELTVT